MIIDRLRKRLCRDLLADVGEVDGRSVAVTTFTYPNGDSINLYFGKRGDDLVVSDEGATIDFLRSQDITLTEERRDCIAAMCEPFAATVEGPRLVRNFQMEGLGAACVGLAQAATQVASLFYQAKPNLRSPLPVTVHRILRERVARTRGIEEDWVARRFDHEAAYPVDYRANGVGEPRHVFTVTSPKKAVLVSAVVHFLRSHRIDVPTMTIVDPEADLDRPDINRLQLASTELKWASDKKMEQDLVKFALSGMKSSRAVGPR
jgi:hypothetical protein